MNYKKLRVIVVGAALASVITGGLLATFFYVSGSSTLHADDPQTLYLSSVHSSVNEDKLWSYESKVTEGEHPWGINHSITSGYYGTDIRKIEFPELGITVVENGEHSYAEFADKNLIDLKGWDGRLSLAPFRGVVDAVLSELEASKLIASPVTLLAERIVDNVLAESKEGKLLTIYRLNSFDEPRTLPGLLDIVEGSDLRGAADYDASYQLEFVRGESWVDVADSSLVKLSYDLKTDKGSYRVEVTPNGESASEISPVTETQTTKLGQQQLADFFSPGLLNRLGLNSFATQLADIIRLHELATAAAKVKAFSEENLYYPTPEQLSRLLSETDGASTSSVLNYSASPVGCDNQKDNYCAGYQLSTDAGLDGLGDADVDGDINDLIFGDD